MAFKSQGHEDLWRYAYIFKLSRRVVCDFYIASIQKKMHSVIKAQGFFVLNSKPKWDSSAF